MAIIHVDETYPGLPNSGRLSGTNGDLVGIMDIALVANGWSIEYSSGNARIYRPGSGNRFRLYMNDDSASSGAATMCLVRGCENASSASDAGLVDPFPLPALVANNLSNWTKSNLANTTARTFDIWVSPTWVIFSCNWNGTAQQYTFNFFGDVGAALPGDSYNTICMVGNTTNANIQQGWGWGNTTNSSTGALYLIWARSFDGTVKSTRGQTTWVSTSVGALSAGSQAQAGPTGKVDRQKIPLQDMGNSTVGATFVPAIGLVTRGWMPNVWMPLHVGKGTLSGRDTFIDTGYNASADFSVVSKGSGVNDAFFIIETTDTWSIPSG